MTAHLATLRFSTKQWLYPKPLHNLSKTQVNVLPTSHRGELISRGQRRPIARNPKGDWDSIQVIIIPMALTIGDKQVGQIERCG